TGTVAGSVQVNQGSVAPGPQAAAGTLTVSSATLGLGASLLVNIGSTASELVANGALDLSAGTLAGTLVSGFASSPGKTYVIAQSPGTLSAFPTLPEGSFVTLGTELFQVHSPANGKQVVLGDAGPAQANPVHVTIQVLVNGAAVSNG